MRKMQLKGLMVIAAMLVCLSASAIDKVIKYTGLDNEVTSLEELKSKKVILQNADGKMLYIPGVGGETSWDFKMTDLVNGLSSNNGAFLSAIDYDGHLIFQVFNLNGEERATPSWAGGKAYLNSQPEGGSLIFGLAGMNDQHGADGPNLAVWDVAYVEGQGFSFHNVGRNIYLGYDATDARPSTSVVYWKAFTAYHASYVQTEVEAAYEQTIAAARTTETIKALEAAKLAFDSSADLNAFGDAVNAAIDVVNACQAVNAEYANLDEAGAAVAADVLAKYENKEYANIAELRAAYILAAKAQTTAGANMTGAIVNPSFELGTLEGWTSTDGGAIATNYNFAQRTGDKFVERWTQAPNTLSNGSLKQTIKGLPNGTYTLTAEMQNVNQHKNYAPSEGYYLVANDAITEVTAPGETVSVTTVVTNGNLTIGTVIDKCTGNWVCVDNFSLTYLGEKEDVNSTIPGTTVSGTYKWGTFISQVNRLLPEGLEAYTCTGIIDDDKLKLEEATYIKANTAYILKNTTETDIVIPDVKGVSKAAEESYTTGLLTGSYVKTNVLPANSYILQSQNGKTGFYLCNTTGLSVGQNRCYLTLPNGRHNARSFIFNEDGATGVPTLKPETLDKLSNGKIYDVNGRELKSQQKGINIINGRKVNVR